jgi:hypothetical protein
MEKLRSICSSSPLWMCPPVIDDKSCVTVIVNTFVVLLNLSVAVPIAVELFVGTSFDPINISAEKVVILGPELIHHHYKMINLPKGIMPLIN